MENNIKGRISQTIKKTFYSFRNRNFRLFFIGQLISNTGNWLTNVAVVLLVLKITGSGLAVGLVSAFQFGPILFLSPLAGAIADRLDKRRMLLITQSLEMLQSIGLAIVAFMPHPSVDALYILAIAGGAILAFDNPLRRSFVSEMVPKEDIPNAVVLYSTIVNISRIFGPALAGLLIVTLGYGWGFSIDAATYLAVIFCIFIMKSAELYLQPPKPKSKGDIREGLKYIMSVPSLWISFVMLAAIGTFSYNFTVTLSLFVIRSLHGTNVVFTTLYSVFSFGAVICSFIIAHRNLVKIRHIILGAAVLGVTMILLGFTSGVITAMAASFLVGMASILYMTSSTAIVQVEGKREMHGRLLAWQSVFLLGTSVIGGPLCGWLADITNARLPIIFGGVVCLLAAAFGYASVKYYGKVDYFRVNTVD